MSTRPNVLFICTDEWPGALLGCHGDSASQTPTIDFLARNGLDMRKAYSECPVCIPARRCLMTGLSPRSHGDRVYSDTMRMPDATTMARAFSQAGWQTVAVGKLHVYPQRDRIGFDDVSLLEEGRCEFGVFLLRQFYISIPDELLEAARIDGLSEYGTFSRIVLPLTKPAMATLIIMSFVTVWNDYMGPMIYFTSDRNKTIQLGVQMFVGQYSAEYGLIMATSVLALVPVLVVFLAFQRFFVEGIASSGLKG